MMIRFKRDIHLKHITQSCPHNRCMSKTNITIFTYFDLCLILEDQFVNIPLDICGSFISPNLKRL